MTPLDDYAGVKPEFANVANITEQAGTAAQQLIKLSAQRHISMHLWKYETFLALCKWQKSLFPDNFRSNGGNHHLEVHAQLGSEP
jgi:hypothetical protein